MERFQRDMRIVRLQHLPLVEHALGQSETLVRHCDIDTLFQPRRIGLRVVEQRQFVGQHLGGTVSLTRRQQAIERQLRIFAPLGGLLTVTSELQIDLRSTPRLFGRHVPLRSGFE